MDKKTELLSTFKGFENGQIISQQVLDRITQLTGKELNEHVIRTYWTYTSLDNFCEMLLTEPIANWQELDDVAALKLIDQILDYTTDESIVDRNEEALEKRFRKPTGFVYSLISNSEGISNLNILEQLKNDTTIYL